MKNREPDPAHGSWFLRDERPCRPSNYLEVGTDLPRPEAPEGATSRLVSSSVLFITSTSGNQKSRRVGAGGAESTGGRLEVSNQAPASATRLFARSVGVYIAEADGCPIVRRGFWEGPMEPQQPTPVVAWEPPPTQEAPRREGEPVGALHNNRSPSTFTLGDAITTGFGLVAKPTFVVPVLIIGVVVNAIVSAIVQPLIPSQIGSGSTISSEQVTGILRGAFSTVILSIIGSILINLYGQIWTVEATSGSLPSVDRVIGLAAKRWLGIIGTGITVGVISIGLLIVSFIVMALAFVALGNLGLLVLLALIVVDIWVGARLSMAGWLAAEGLPIADSIAGSWQITRNNLLRIIGWGIGYGIVFAIVGGIVGIILSFVPVIGPGISETISLALGYGAGVTLYRRTQAAARPPVATTEAPAAATA
jgi:hypothetical protein